MIIPTVAFARIGENKAQCDTRYGTAYPVSGNPDATRYKKHGFLIKVEFYKGKCHEIIYVNPDKTGLTDSELNAFLRANGTGWVKVGSTHLKQWVNPSSKAYSVDDAIQISTREYERKQELDKERKKSEQLGDF